MVTKLSMDTWNLNLDCLFNSVGSSSDGTHLIDDLLLTHDPSDTNSSASKHSSNDGIDYNDSVVYSVSPSDAISPLSDTERADYVDRRVELVWPPDSQDSMTGQPIISEQHHEKSCARCSLTEMEARKCKVDRRREQNRESQRKFRARKEAKLKEVAGQVANLEAYVEILERYNSDLEEANNQLKRRISDLSSSSYICQSHTTQLHEPQHYRRSSSSWSSIAALDQSATSAQEPIVDQISTMHLSLFDHDLAPPSGMSTNGR